MDAECKRLCEAMRKSIVECDCEEAHALLAPWLRSTMAPAEIPCQMGHIDAGVAD